MVVAAPSAAAHTAWFAVPLELPGKRTMHVSGRSAADAAPVAIGTAWFAISKHERDGVIEFGFTVYAVQEKGEWRWRSIQFACDQVPTRE